jgi:hypothetical protein
MYKKVSVAVLAALCFVLCSAVTTTPVMALTGENPAIPSSSLFGGGGGGGSGVNLMLMPSSQSASLGGTFVLTTQAQCGTLTTDGIEVYLDFDPNYLAVQSATSGTALSTILMSPTWDNTLGTFGFSAGQLSGTLPTGNFTVMTITFQAKAITSTSTHVSFHTSGARLTMVDMGGNNITGSLTGTTVDISADVPLCLDPASVSSVCSGQTFNLAIKTNTGSNQQVSGVQAYLNFDASRLEVVDADSVNSGIQITPGSSLDTVLENIVDNSNGVISYSAGKLGSPFPSGSFTVASIQFRAKTVTANVTTAIMFSLSGPATTSMVDYLGAAVPGTHANATITLVPGVNVEINVKLQGSARPEAGWIVPLTVKFYAPGTADEINGTPIYTFTLNTIKSGSTAILPPPGLIINPGTYDITATITTTLCNVKKNVLIAPPSVDINMGTLLEGDATRDHVVNIQDFGTLAGTYGKQSGQTGFNAMTDFDRNGTINIADFGLLAGNYGKRCLIQVP